MNQQLAGTRVTKRMADLATETAFMNKQLWSVFKSASLHFSGLNRRGQAMARSLAANISFFFLNFNALLLPRPLDDGRYVCFLFSRVCVSIGRSFLDADWLLSVCVCVSINLFFNADWLFSVCVCVCQNKIITLPDISIG